MLSALLSVQQLALVLESLFERDFFRLLAREESGEGLKVFFKLDHTLPITLFLERSFALLAN